MIHPGPLPPESEVRKLRDICFDQPISDKEWEFCKEHWMEPAKIRWLREHQFDVKKALGNLSCSCGPV